MNIKKLINNNKWEEIYDAIKNKKVDVYQKINGGNLIAHYAAINNDANIIKYFLENDKNVLIKGNDDGNTPIHLLAQYDYTNLLKVCLSKYPDFLTLVNNDNETIANILYHDLDFISFIVKNPKLNKINILVNDTTEENIITKNIKDHKQINDKHYKIIKLLLKTQKKYINDISSTSLLSESIKEDKLDLSKLLVKEGYDINKKDQEYITPFLYAIKKRDYDLMELLIKKGANINYTGPEGDYNPMIYAINHKDERMINLLLDSKFDLKMHNRYLDTPLHHILNDRGKNFGPSVISKFLYYGDLNSKNIHGETPLHLLCKNYNFMDYNQIIAHKKVDIFAEDDKSKRPFDYIKGDYIYNFMDTVVNSYSRLIEGNITYTDKCKNIKSEECRKELKKYIFKTKRSIPVVEDQMIMSNRIKVVEGEKVLHGLFNSDILHNVIYTITMLKKYQNLGVPFQYFFKDKKMSDKIILENNDVFKYQHEFTISNLIKIYTDTFYELSPYLIVWRSKYQYYINPNLNIYLKKLLFNKNIRFIMLKLTLITDLGTHANIIIYDKQKNTLERFEPYGVVPYLDSNELDEMLEKWGKDVLNAKYWSPKDIFKNIGNIGFQTISNDSKQESRKLGDPAGYCLAWTFWYLEMRINNPEVTPNELLEKSLKKILEKDSVNRSQLFVSFIRDYAAKLDKLKNNFMINAGVNKNNIYNLVLLNEDHQKVINKLTFEFRMFVS
jgi:ankyrin repeat protein